MGNQSLFADPHPTGAREVFFENVGFTTLFIYFHSIPRRERTDTLFELSPLIAR